MSAEEDELEQAFGHAEPVHFAWRTEGPFVAERERDLVRAAFLPVGERVLDLGCGEGATLLHLGAPEGAVGVDLFEGRLSFARERLPRCRFVNASVYDLPFPDASFDHLLVRDVVHHLDKPERFVDECARVVAPGGRIDLLEPCRYNPLIALHAVTVHVERGELRSTRAYLTELLERRFDVVSTRHFQALPIHRIVFHPTLGRPELAGRPSAQAAVRGLERLAEALMPEWAWAYLHLRAVTRS